MVSFNVKVAHDPDAAVAMHKIYRRERRPLCRGHVSHFLAWSWPYIANSQCIEGAIYFHHTIAFLLIIV